MEELQPFARSLRELMAHHPKDGRVTTPAELAEELGTSAQTISYYVNGKHRPSYENIISLIHYFDVSADYLLEPKSLNTMINPHYNSPPGQFPSFISKK